MHSTSVISPCAWNPQTYGGDKEVIIRKLLSNWSLTTNDSIVAARDLRIEVFRSQLSVAPRSVLRSLEPLIEHHKFLECYTGACRINVESIIDITDQFLLLNSQSLPM